MTDTEAAVEATSQEKHREHQSLKTSDVYRTKNLPERFDRPELQKGYCTRSENPMFTTSSGIYGSQPPTIHTVSPQFHGRYQKFSKYWGTFEMYRNCSFNTSTDKSKV